MTRNAVKEAPVTISEAIRVVLVAIVTALGFTLDDALVTSLAGAVAVVVSIALSKFTAQRVELVDKS